MHLSTARKVTDHSCSVYWGNMRDCQQGSSPPPFEEPRNCLKGLERTGRTENFSYQAATLSANLQDEELFYMVPSLGYACFYLDRQRNTGQESHARRMPGCSQSPRLRPRHGKLHSGYQALQSACAFYPGLLRRTIDYSAYPRRHCLRCRQRSPRDWKVRRPQLRLPRTWRRKWTFGRRHAPLQQRDGGPECAYGGDRSRWTTRKHCLGIVCPRKTGN